MCKMWYTEHGNTFERLNEMNAGTIKRENLYEQVADALEKNIFSGQLPEGTRLPPEQELADQFGVSRNVVREAFKALRERGLIEIRNGDGTYVTSPDFHILSGQVKRMINMNLKDMWKLYEVRMIFETSSAQLLIERITPENLNHLAHLADEMEKHVIDTDEYVRLDTLFHRQIVKSVNNELLYALYRPMVSSMEDVIRSVSQSLPDRRRGVRQHKEMVMALRQGDKRFCDLIKNHIEGSKEDIYTFMKTKQPL